MADYAGSPGRTTLFPAATGGPEIRVNDTTHQFLIRPGAAFTYAKDSNVFADYQFGWFHNDAGTLNVHRFFVGVDHRVVDAFFVRGGLAVDTRGNLTPTAGVGIYPNKTVSIDLGYQYNNFPEIGRELGRAHSVMLSIGINF